MADNSEIRCMKFDKYNFYLYAIPCGVNYYVRLIYENGQYYSTYLEEHTLNSICGTNSADITCAFNINQIIILLPNNPIAFKKSNDLTASECTTIFEYIHSHLNKEKKSIEQNTQVSKKCKKVLYDLTNIKNNMYLFSSPKEINHVMISAHLEFNPYANNERNIQVLYKLNDGPVQNCDINSLKDNSILCTEFKVCFGIYAGILIEAGYISQ
jgi:hypothetical protein